jgi:fused signal recognition particle receptor
VNARSGQQQRDAGKIGQGLQKTKSTWFQKLTRLFTETYINPEVWDDLEEALLGADVGLDLSERLIEQAQQRVQKEGLRRSSDLYDVLRGEMLGLMGPLDYEERPVSVGREIILVVGVNGSGKTTSIAKLAKRKMQQKRSVLLAAADTFRAAAIDQLQVWGRRVNAEVIAHQPGADPAAVVFDSLQAAKSRNTQTLIIDTAGRLQTKSNLMEELRKVHRVIEREAPDVPVDVLLVLDATTGQNGLSQAREFLKAVKVDALVVSKLDGTAKGGVVLAIQQELGIPIAYIGTGEGVDDLAEFDPAAFVTALVG